MGLGKATLSIFSHARPPMAARKLVVNPAKLRFLETPTIFSYKVSANARVTRHNCAKLGELTASTDKVSASEVKNVASDSYITPITKVIKYQPRGNDTGIIYKKIKQADGTIKKIPITATIKTNGNVDGYTRFLIYDGKNIVGSVKLTDRYNKECKLFGLNVDMIENYKEEAYSGIGLLADRIEIEYSLLRGLSPKNISSVSLPDAIIAHYKRGKRFIAEDNTGILENRNINDILQELIDSSPKGSKIDIGILKKLCLRTYMPDDLISTNVEYLLKFPILSRI